MLKFGKKVTYRPILISFYYCLIPLICAIYFQWLTMYAVAVVVFIVILIGYYTVNLPLIFSYWENDRDTIKYNDMSQFSNRLKMILCPFKNQLTTIRKQDIESITVRGNLNKPETIAAPIEVTLIYAFLTPLLSMLKNPLTLELSMKNGQKITLNVARDFAYSQKKTTAKLQQFFDSLDNTQIKIYNYQNHNIGLN